MSSDGSQGPPVGLMKSLLSSVLSSTLLFMFLAGIYLMIFVGTIYVYVTRKTERSLIIIATLSGLYLVTLANLAVNWASMVKVFVDHSDTLLSEFEFIEIWDAPLALAGTILQNVGYILADGLLLWRCYHMTSGSLMWMLIPSVLYVFEVALCIGFPVIGGIVSLHPFTVSVQMGRAEDIVSGTLAAVTAATSLSATYIIARRIVTSMDDGMPTKGRYQQIIRILIQSSLLYSLTSVLFAVSSILTVAGDTSQKVSNNLFQYAVTLNVIMTGLAPTLMVAQISISAGRPLEAPPAKHFSALKFGGQMTSNDSSSPTMDHPHAFAMSQEKSDMIEKTDV